MSITAEPATRFRLADPKPSRCSACWTAAGPDVDFVDFDCLLDRGAIVEEGTMAVLEGMDALYLCRACVLEAQLVLGLEDYRDVLRRQVKELQAQSLRADHYRDGEAREHAENERLRARIRELEAERPAVTATRSRRREND